VLRYASAVYAMAMCLSVCPSQASIVPIWLNIGLCKQRNRHSCQRSWWS